MAVVKRSVLKSPTEIRCDLLTSGILKIIIRRKCIEVCGFIFIAYTHIVLGGVVG